MILWNFSEKYFKIQLNNTEEIYWFRICFLFVFSHFLFTLLIHGTHVTANNSTTYNVVFFFTSHLKIIDYNKY